MSVFFTIHSMTEHNRHTKIIHVDSTFHILSQKALPTPTPPTSELDKNCINCINCIYVQTVYFLIQLMYGSRSGEGQEAQSEAIT